MFMRMNLFLSVSALGIALCACSFETAGTSDETEGVVALADKKIVGAVQKGPFVKGSDVVLRETSADGSLEPTGREFTTKTINDKGDFEFDSLELESQYALLSAEGYYTREVNSQRSHCVLRLNAVSNLEKRNTANINMLTHFEYKRVLKLVEEGKSFAQAKRQAATELMNAFGVDVPAQSAEDLNIFNTSYGDRTLYHLSVFVDRDFFYPHDDDVDEWEYERDTANIDCSKLQEYVDSFADDLAEDGTLSDFLIAPLAAEAYLINTYFGNVMYGEELGLKDKDEYALMAERTYFYKLVLDHYLGFETCNDSRWGESRRLDKPFRSYDDDAEMEYENPAYFLCDGTDWKQTTKGHLDCLKMPIPHESGIMKDPRDGREYKTVSFEFNGNKYEWMAEDLMYSITPETPTKGGLVNRRQAGVYSWAEAMRLSESYMSKPVRDGSVDSLHQGICPDGWHISNSLDWEALVTYVGGVNNLLNESWKTDPETAAAKDLFGVFYDRFDFNLYPMDKKYLDLYYHTYTDESFIGDIEAERLMWWDYYEEHKDTEDVEWILGYANDYGNYRDIKNHTFEISIDYGMPTDEPRKAARVRCVKN